MATETDILTTLLEAMDGISAPALTVQEGLQRLEALPAGTIQITPLGLAREPGGGGRQQWHLSILIAVATRLSGEANEIRMAPVLAATRAVLRRLDDATVRATLRGVGGLDLRRGDLSYWIKPPGGPGDPAGGLMRVTIDFVE